MIEKYFHFVLYAAFFMGGCLAHKGFSDREIATLKADFEAREKAALINHIGILEKAKQRSDAAEIAVIEKDKSLKKQGEKLNAAIKKQTDGKPCFNAAAVRLLNATDDGEGLPLPPAPRLSFAGTAPFATDQDVGEWAINARTEYDKCRHRIDEIRDFYAD